MTIRTFLMSILFVVGLGVSLQASAQHISGGDSCDDYRSTICLRDEFWGGTGATALIGELGWNLNGGSASPCAGIAGDPGCYTITTTTTPGNVASIYAQGTASVFSPGTWDIVWRVEPGQSDVNTTFHVGMQDSVTTVTPTNGSYFQRLDADSNYFCVTRAAGTQTRTDSGVATGTAVVWLRQVRTGNLSVDFYINDVRVCSHTSDLHAVNTNAVLAIKTSSAASKTINARFFQLRAEVSR